MKHTFRINVCGKGYTLYSGETLLSYQEYNLGIKSDGISKNYLAAQERLDSLMEKQVSRWYLAVAKITINENPIVAYGCFLSAKDDKDRSGIRFIHAIESTSDWNAEDIVLAIIQMLSPKNTNKIRELISGVAIGNSIINDLTDYIASVCKKQDFNDSDTSPPYLNTRPIKEIKQDCSGATALAWLTMTISHSNTPPPWEIYEKYINYTDTVSIFSSSSEAEKDLSLASYMYAISHNQEFIFQPLYKPQEKSEKNKLGSINDERMSPQLSNKNHLTKYRDKSFWRKLLEKLFLYAEEILRKSNKDSNSKMGMKNASAKSFPQGDNISATNDLSTGKSASSPIDANYSIPPEIDEPVLAIQSLLKKLSEKYNSDHPIGQERICNIAVDEIKKNLYLQCCIVNALRAVSMTELSKAINHPVAANLIDRAKKNIDSKQLDGGV
jgi:hypothetical protein